MWCLPCLLGPAANQRDYKDMTRLRAQHMQMTNIYLLAVSRECGKISCRGYIRIAFAYSLLTSNKFSWNKPGAAASFLNKRRQQNAAVWEGGRVGI